LFPRSNGSLKAKASFPQSFPLNKYLISAGIFIYYN
jgi:hypothetical protein